MTPAVSIVVPTVGRPALLRAALASVVGQSRGDWEAIVVDEGGLDETRTVVESFADERIVLHRQSRRVGIVENWGTGVRLAGGEFVVFLADDDRLSPGFLDTRLAALSSRRDLVVAFAAFEVRRKDGTLVRVQGGDWADRREFEGPGLLTEALSARWFVGAALYRREPVLELWPRLHDDGLVLDLGLNVRLALLPFARGVALPGRNFVMLSHSGQNTEALQDRVWAEKNAVLHRIESEVDDDASRRAIAAERASWLTVWGRDRAARDDLATARRRFAQAVAANPRSRWAWSQLAISLLSPRRLMRDR